MTLTNHDGAPARGERLVDALHPDLFEWQRDALHEWYQRGQRGVVEAVTGAGKTRLGIAAIKDAVKQGMRALVVVPTVELQHQWAKAIRPHFEGLELGLLGGGRADALAEHHVVVAVVNTAATHEGEGQGLLKGIFDGVIVADEVHRYAAPEFVRALSEQFDWRLGLTATYARPDNRHEDVLDPYFGGRIFSLWYDRALRERIVAPFDVAMVGVPLTPQERLRYEECTHVMAQAMGFLENVAGFDRSRSDLFAMLARMAKAAHTGERTSVTAARYLRAVSDRAAILSDSAAKRDVVKVLAPAIQESNGTLVFAAGIESSEDQREVLQRAGVAAAVIHSNQNDAVRRLQLAGFRRGSYKAICAARVLDEGIDVPEADLAISVGGFRQRRQVVQRLGRVIRRKPGGAIGRFVFVFAERTIEDPRVQTAEHLEPVLEFARRSATFSLPREAKLLLRFLRKPRNIEPPATADGSSTGVGDGGRPIGGLRTILEPPAHDVNGPVVTVDGGGAAQPPRGVSPGPATAPTVEVPEPAAPHAPPECEPSDPSPVVPEPTVAPDVVKKKRVVRDPDEDLIADYLLGLRQFPLLTAEQEVELAQRIEAGLMAAHCLRTGAASSRRERHDLEQIEAEGSTATETFVTSNLRLVVSIAKHFLRRGLEFEDLIQEGNLGLFRAVEKFDYTKGTKFSTYATLWIRQAITRALGDQSRIIRLPIHLHEVVMKVVAAEAELGRRGPVAEPGKHVAERHAAAEDEGSGGDAETEVGDGPGLAMPALSKRDLQIAEAASVSEKQMQTVRMAQRLQPMSLSALQERIDTSGNPLVHDWLGRFSDRYVEPHPEEAAFIDEMTGSIHWLLDSMTAREAGVLALRHGLATGETATLAVIGKFYGLTRERIRQIEVEASAKLAQLFLDSPGLGELFSIDGDETEHLIRVAAKVRRANRRPPK